MFELKLSGIQRNLSTYILFSEIYCLCILAQYSCAETHQITFSFNLIHLILLIYQTYTTPFHQTLLLDLHYALSLHPSTRPTLHPFIRHLLTHIKVMIESAAFIKSLIKFFLSYSFFYTFLLYLMQILIILFHQTRNTFIPDLYQTHLIDLYQTTSLGNTHMIDCFIRPVILLYQALTRFRPLTFLLKRKT